MNNGKPNMSIMSIIVVLAGFGGIYAMTGQNIATVRDTNATAIVNMQLQVEARFEGVDKLTDVQLIEINRRLATIEDWRSSHDLRVSGINAAQWERIKAIERAIYGKTRSGIGEEPDSGGP